MPIRPEHRWLYPIDWRELSALVRFTRAGGRCERCGRPHGARVRHLGDGRWYDEERGCWRDDRGRRVRGLPPPGHPPRLKYQPGVKRQRHHAHLPHQLRMAELAGDPVLPSTRVVLASAHLDHDPGNNHPRNLAALCQRCHLAHDRPEHRRRRWATLFRRRALGDLFLGTYR